jgi:peptidoglycan/LPS O-acetylase OafA/YrhL
MAERRLPGLDGLRGVAAFSVLIYHIIPVATGEWRGNAYLAVDFFFMLSGYIMARTYEVQMADGLPARAFLAARLRRLWPTMFAAGLVALPTFFLVYGFDHAQYALANLLLIPTLNLRWAYPLNAVAWSIFFELFANAVHALLLRRLSVRLLLVIGGLTIPILLPAAARLTLDIGSQSEAFVFGFPRVLLSYVIGIVLWRCWRDKPSLAVSPGLAFLAMPFFFGVGTYFDGNSWQGGLLFIAVICPVMIAGALRCSKVWAPVRLAGELSFPLYAFHTPIFAIAAAAGLHVAWTAGLSVLAAYLFSRIGSVHRALRRDRQQPCPTAECAGPLGLSNSRAKLPAYATGGIRAPGHEIA